MSPFPTIVQRSADPGVAARLVAGGCHPLLARVYAARGIAEALELDDAFDRLHRPDSLCNAGKMAQMLADAIETRAKLLIVADYDADGATACAVGIRALRAFGGERRLPRAEPFRVRLWAHARDRALAFTSGAARTC